MNHLNLFPLTSFRVTASSVVFLLVITEKTEIAKITQMLVNLQHSKGNTNLQRPQISTNEIFDFCVFFSFHFPDFSAGSEKEIFANSYLKHFVLYLQIFWLFLQFLFDQYKNLPKMRSRETY